MLRPYYFVLVALWLTVSSVSAEGEASAAWERRESEEETAQKLMARDVSDYDPLLASQPLGEWLGSQLPKETPLAYELNDCGEQAGEPDVDHSRDIPLCLGVTAEIISRARTLTLLFDAETLDYRSGLVLSKELYGRLDLPSLKDVTAALKKPLQLIPLTCEDGTTLKLKQEYAGLFEWCEDELGRKQGPYRSWFSTGIYLLKRGQFKDDVEVGDWIECDRFENCRLETFGSDRGKLLF